jgi:hypothetical protein
VVFPLFGFPAKAIFTLIRFPLRTIPPRPLRHRLF